MRTIILEVEDDAIITVSHARTAMTAMTATNTVKQEQLSPPPVVTSPDDLRGQATRVAVLDVIDCAFSADERNRLFAAFRNRSGHRYDSRLGDLRMSFNAWRRNNQTPQNYNALCLFQLYQVALERLASR